MNNLTKVSNTVNYNKSKSKQPISKEKRVLAQVCKDCGKSRRIPMQFCTECWKEMDRTFNKETVV
jgi:uncharacterized OB-fold protein